MAGQTALGTERNAAETETSDAAVRQEAQLLSQINAAAVELHRLWSERAAGLRDDDPAWSARIRALDAKIAGAYEARREILAQRSLRSGAGRPGRTKPRPGARTILAA
jgi:hypothetical protein